MLYVPTLLTQLQSAQKMLTRVQLQFCYIYDCCDRRLSYYKIPLMVYVLTIPFLIGRY